MEGAATRLNVRDGWLRARARFPDYVLLLKPRVMSLVVFTGGVGMAVAPGHVTPATVWATLLSMAGGAGACGALNMWYDADIDARMARTASRPVASGRMKPAEALIFGCLLAALSVLSLGVLVNWLAAALLELTIGFYVLIYTVGLKRNTPQNIVIGGAAGALPPVIGWAASAQGVDWGALALFMIIFLWTPPHFWALAIRRSDDYARVNVPMMPVVQGREKTARMITLYALSLLPASLWPAYLGIAGWPYAIFAGAMSLFFVWRALQLQRAKETPQVMRQALKVFGFSIVYLFALFTALLAGALVRGL